MIVLRPTLAALLTELGVQEREAAVARIREAAGVPWYVALASGLAAWVAAGLLLGCVLGSLLDRADQGLLVGIVGALGASAARWGQSRPEVELPPAARPFLRQLTLAAMITAEGLVLAALGEWTTSAGHWLASAGVLAAAVVLYPDRLHRFGATVAAGACLGAGVHELSDALPLHLAATPLYAGSLALFQWGPALERAGWGPVRAPVAYGLLVGAFALIVLALWGPDAQQAQAWVTSAGLTLGVSAAAVGMLWEAGIREPRVAAVVVGLLLVLGGITLSTPGVVAALGVLAMAFHRRSPLLFGMGSAFLTVFLTAYYYDLALTLWVKAGVLIGSGLLLLGARTLLSRGPVEAA